MSTPQNDAFRILAPKPVDNRYLKNDTIPWVSIAEVNTAILSAYRHKGLTVLIGTQEYWYLNGVTDGDLIPKNSSSINITLNLSADGFYTFPFNTLIVALIVTPDVDINFKAGSANGLEDFVPTLQLEEDIPAPLAVFLYRLAGQSIYFGGISGSNTTIVIKTL